MLFGTCHLDYQLAYQLNIKLRFPVLLSYAIIRNYFSFNERKALNVKNKYIIPFFTDHEEMAKYGVEFYFYPKVPLSRKNFF